MNDQTKSYLARMKRVLDFIDGHLEDELNLDRLADVAAYSKFHFHRQFSACFGLSVHHYVQLARVRKAAYQLIYRDQTVTAVALSSEYEAPDAFSRAFRQRMGQSPSEFRRSPDWLRLNMVLEPYERARSRIESASFELDDVSLVEFPRTGILYLSHMGNPDEAGITLRKFIQWRKQSKLPPDQYATFSIYFDDPCYWPEQEYREDFAVAAPAREKLITGGVKKGIIEAGRCASLEVRGDADQLETAIRFLYGTWLPSSHEQLRDFPVFCQRMSMFPDVPAQKTLSRLYLPIK